MGTQELEERLRELRKAQQEATRTYAAAQARLEQAQQARDSEVAALAEMGFDSVDEAEAWLGKAETEISEALASITAKIET